jgi:hypothetical protein
MDEVIKKWLEMSLPKVSSVHPVTVHLRDLLGEVEPPIESVNKSIQAFNILIEQLTGLGTPVKPVLVISLKSYSHKFDNQSPMNMEELSNQLDQYESPSLYLLDWQLPKSIALCEELRVPFSAPWLGVNIHTYLYYREFRYSMAINNKWEVSRAIYAEYYPDGIMVQ